MIRFSNPCSAVCVKSANAAFQRTLINQINSIDEIDEEETLNKNVLAQSSNVTFLQS